MPARLVPFAPEVPPRARCWLKAAPCGSGTAGAATAGAAGVEVLQDVLAETQSTILPLVPYLDTLRWVLIAIALIVSPSPSTPCPTIGSGACGDRLAPHPWPGAKGAGPYPRRRKRAAERLDAREKRCHPPQMLDAAALLIAMLWLTGCATAGSDTRAPCPPVVDYMAEDQARAAEEVETLPEGAVIVRMLSDYAMLRDQVRA